MNRMLILAVLLSVTAGLVFAPVAAACPGCKEAVAAADDENGTPAAGYSREGAAYSYSVFFMLGMPAVLLGAFGTAFYRMVRKARLNSPSFPGRGDI